MSNKHIVICDLDGTLADVRHRLHHLEGKKDWAAFNAACVDDPPFEDIISVVSTLSCEGQTFDWKPLELYILSGRNEIVRAETEVWLEKHFGYYSNLLMRGANDKRPDVEVKLDMARQIGATPDNVLCIFDDRQCVVDMWRANGFRVLQVAAWKEK